MWTVFLVGAAAVTLLIRPLRKRGFFPRLKVWFYIIPVFFTAIFLGRGAFFSLVMLCFGASYYELAKLNKEKKIWRHLVSLSLAVPWILGARFFGFSYWLLVPAFLAFTAVLYIFLTRNRDRRLNLPVFSFILGVFFSYWIYLYDLGGYRLPLFVFSVVSFCDIMAFVYGRLWGKYRPFPTISPNKTTAGYAGGFISAVVAAFIFRFTVPELNSLQLVSAGLLLIASGTAGDLLGSKIKRLYGIKDFSRLLGPMGGITDRLDSLLITMGICYCCLLVMI